MHPHAQLIEKFYDSFQRKDAAGMAACYDPAVTFADPVFTLRGKQANAMWAMFCAGGGGLVVTHGGVQADDARGQARWEARYTFSGSGRMVHNVIEAAFEFHDGRIIAHRDRFDFWRWARMALAPTGALLGWTPLLRRRVQRAARARLGRFIQANPAYQG